MCSPVTAKAQTPADTYVVQSSTETFRLQQECEKSRELLAGDFCAGYIIGVFDALAWERVICPPSTGGTTASALAIAKRYLTNHPEKWSSAPSAVVREALEGAFPCATKRR